MNQFSASLMASMEMKWIETYLLLVLVHTVSVMSVISIDATGTNTFLAQNSRLAILISRFPFLERQPHIVLFLHYIKIYKLPKFFTNLRELKRRNFFPGDDANAFLYRNPEIVHVVSWRYVFLANPIECHKLELKFYNHPANKSIWTATMRMPSFA